MSEARLQSDGRFLSKLFFRMLPAQVFLLLIAGINNMVSGLIGTFIGRAKNRIRRRHASFLG